MSPLIGYSIKRGKSWNHIHISNTKETFKTIYMCTHMCRNTKDKEDIKLKEYKREHGVVRKQGHERG